MVLHALHLCSGYGGFELALRLAGINARTVAHVERDAYAAATLVARMEEAHLDQAPIWSDLTTFDGAAWRGRVDLITAGFPCQPFSAAGQQRGVDDERWLWPAIGRLISDVGPSLVFLENVPQLVRLGLPHVLSDLAELGFDAEWGLHSAAEAGAPHRRERVWILAHGHGHGREGFRRSGRLIERDVDGRSRSDLADANRERPRGQRVPVGRPLDGTEAGGCCADVGHACSSRRPEVTGGSSGDEGACTGSYRGCGGHVAHSPGEGMADTEGQRHAGGVRDSSGTQPTQPRPADPRSHAWPPGRDDRDGWTDYIGAGGPEPSIRRGADGRPPELADALHLGGNGLVPAVAAAAFVELASRLGVDIGGL